MNRVGHENTQFFYGHEVEHTPAHGQYTMFVVGCHDVEDVRLRLTTGPESGINHIYFGANMSFPKCQVNDVGVWRPWETMIKFFLEYDYLCTLDIDVSCAEGLLESGLTEYHNFIPMISVKLPYINQFGYNATLKIDDRDFAATNPGVWCHSLHELQDRSRFTDWSKYTKDETV
jgi:hypothetical protein